MSVFDHDGLHFHYVDSGTGSPFVFQHGLGGDVCQPTGLFSPPFGVRLISMDCRAHGETKPLGDEDKLTIKCFADDLLALMDHLNLQDATIGGISMGAALTLNLTLRFPGRVNGLVLSRPAWLEGPNKKNREIFSTIAGLIRDHGTVEGKELFLQSDLYQEVREASSDSAASLAGQFDNPRAKETLIKLERIGSDAPNRSLDELKSIEVPVLVMANRLDVVHPYDFGRVLADTIPGARFRELTPKSVSVDRHGEDVQSFLEEFLMYQNRNGKRQDRC
jgi:pimeloyl-ACP methyl ester carboxylesterase